MTGELADCFRKKADGVRQILAAVQEAAPGCEICAYLVDGRFATLDEARELPQLAAASNWRALAQFACRFAENRPCLLIDIGSTTTDMIPLMDGGPCSRGFSDTERLLARALIYTGVGRTPICALMHELPWRGGLCPVAAEFFATTADVYVLLGDMAEQPLTTDTADGRPLTKEFARERLARMICADANTFSDGDAVAAATCIRDRQAAVLADALRAIENAAPHRIERYVVSGQGEFLARRIITEVLAKPSVFSLSDALGPQVSTCAPAHALAVLACERH